MWYVNCPVPSIQSKVYLSEQFCCDILKVLVNFLKTSSQSCVCNDPVSTCELSVCWFSALTVAECPLIGPPEALFVCHYWLGFKGPCDTVRLKGTPATPPLSPQLNSSAVGGRAWLEPMLSFSLRETEKLFLHSGWKKSAHDWIRDLLCVMWGAAIMSKQEVYIGGSYVWMPRHC